MSACFDSVIQNINLLFWWIQSRIDPNGCNETAIQAKKSLSERQTTGPTLEQIPSDWSSGGLVIVAVVAIVGVVIVAIVIKRPMATGWRLYLYQVAQICWHNFDSIVIWFRQEQLSASPCHLRHGS